ncbi:hypothetical protein BCR39DRAFT_495391 [Naematelia encephala]|uniref:Uncharacterized protein n=1 Tax=Naematelia encephala TaxID=71784 RepID=A0A1Y2B477_9TREE|nr:hypothetical protein BCR39DRAFT_495391 [Naematelia encephala]
MIRTLAGIAILSALAASASPCVQFDTSFNLYAFGGTSDVNLGQNTSWASPSPQTLTTTGRPPWTGNDTQCLLSQYNNAMYVLNADAANPSDIYIYSFGSSSWSTQTTSSAPTNFGGRSSSVLDHDTNVFFTLPSGSGSTLYTLDFSSVQATATGSALAWETVSNPSFSTDNYTPTAAMSSNHVFWFGVPSTAAGSADVFVVHYSYFQPDAQAFPTSNGGTTFPDTSGQAISIPNADPDTIPYQMLFVPNDFSAAYILTHYTDPGNYSVTSTAPFSQSLINTTQTLAAPSTQDANSAYAASDSALVQVTSNGDIYYMTGAISAYTVSSSATWTKMSYSLSGVTGGSTTTSSNSTSSSSSAAAAASSGSASSTASGASSAASTTASASASHSATASASGSAAASSTGAGRARAIVGANRADLAGLALGVVALGAAMVL